MPDRPKFLEGHLLVAIPHLADQNFFRSVVLIIQHSEDGAAGVILNRPSDLTIKELWAQAFDEVSPGVQAEDPVWLGGPVEGSLIALHKNRSLGEIEVLPDLFALTSLENLHLVVENPTASDLKVFQGYSGWGAGQLEAEIEQGGWLSQPANVNHVFMDPGEMWKTVCDEIGHKILGSQLGGISPIEPGMN